MRQGSRAVAAGLTFAGLLTAAAGASQFSVIDSAQGMLPKNVIPTLYVIDVAPNPQTMKIAGHERVTVVVRKPASTIVLNALQITFGRVTLDGSLAAHVSQDEGRQQATLSFARPVTAGTHVLDITYTATLQTSAQGLSKQGYTDASGKPQYMYGSQLESTDARRLFPGWDEPAFKARFRVSFVVPSDWTAVSNTPVVSTVPVGLGRKRVSFQTTPLMSTYLVVLCAGDLQKVSTVADGIKLSVYTVRGQIPHAQYALSVMQDLMPYYDAYYGVKFPISKLDSIAIPGGFPGAMENWGGITYHDSTILFDPAVQPASDEKDVFNIIAHEESHQWNGDLTTFAWWDDVWLAEGFATWMQTKAPDHFHPEWHMYVNADSDAQFAMARDAQITTHAIYIPVHNETEAAAVFDEIAYTKAGAVFRMLEQYMGPAKFEAALQQYYRTHQYTSFSASDLWRDLSAASGTNVTAVAHNWIYQPGFPVITVTASCSNGARTIALAQQRYLNDASLAPRPTVWSVPINLKTDATGARTTPVLLTGRTQTIDGGSCSTPFVLNGDSVGFYRTQYDAQAQTAQQAAFLKLSTGDRLSLLNDSEAFAESGRAKIDAYLAYAKADAGDDDPFVVGAILSQYREMLTYEKNKPGEAAFQKFIVAQVKPMLAQFGGWDGTGMSDDQLQVRNQILSLLARSGDADTIAEASRRFTAILQNPRAYPPLTKEEAIAIAGYAADARTYQELLGVAMKATNPTEQETDFSALVDAKDPALAARSLEMSLHLPPQFAPYAPFIVSSVAREDPKLAWAFLNQNTDKIFASTPAWEKTTVVPSIAGSFATMIPASDIQAYLNAHVPSDNAAEAKRTMDDVNTRQAVEDRLLPQIDAYVASQ
jgi:aminopeptidase N